MNGGIIGRVLPREKSRLRQIRLEPLFMVPTRLLYRCRRRRQVRPPVCVAKVQPRRRVMNHWESAIEQLESHIVEFIIVVVKNEGRRGPRLQSRNNVLATMGHYAVILEYLEVGHYIMREVGDGLQALSIAQLYGTLPPPRPPHRPVPLLESQQGNQRTFLKTNVRLHNDKYLVFWTGRRLPCDALRSTSRHYTRVPYIGRNYLLQIGRRYYVINIRGVLCMLPIVRTHENEVVLSHNVVGEMVLLHKDGGLNVNIQNISEVDLEEAAANHLHKLPDERVDTHADFQHRNHILHWLAQNILRNNHSTFSHNPWNVGKSLRLFIYKENGRVAHGLKHPVKPKDILEQTVGEEIFLCNRGRAQKNDFAVSYVVEALYIGDIWLLRSARIAERIC